MADTVENIRYTMTVDGQQSTATAFENTAKAVVKSDVAFKEAAKSARAVQPAFTVATKAANDNAQAFDGMVKGTARVLPAFSALGNAAAGLSPMLGDLAGAVGRAGGAMAGMTAVIGGTAGLAAGGLVAALGLLSEFMKTVKSDSEKMADAIDLADAAMTRMRRVDSSTDAAKAKRRAQGLLIAGNFGNGSTDPGFVGTGGNKAALDEISALEATGNIGPDIKGGAGKRADTEFETMQRRAALDKQLARLNSMGNGPTLEDRQNDPAGKAAIQEKRDAAAELHSQFMENARERAKVIDAEKKHVSELGEAGKEAYQGIGATAANALSSIARGQKVTLKEVMGAIGGELVGKGVMWGFEGGAKLASSYGADPAGWELLGLGAAAVAAGMGMGAAASAGNSTPRGSRSIASPSDPAWRTDTTGGRSQQTINVNYSSTFAPTAQDGQRAVQAIQEAQRQGLVNAP